MYVCDVGREEWMCVCVCVVMYWGERSDVGYISGDQGDKICPQPSENE